MKENKKQVKSKEKQSDPGINDYWQHVLKVSKEKNIDWPISSIDERWGYK